MKAFTAAVYIVMIVCCMPALCYSIENKDITARRKPLLHTFVEVKVRGPGAAEAIDSAFECMVHINGLLNNYSDSSEVSQINRNAGISPVPISSETYAALNKAQQYCRLTGGAFDFTIGPLLKIWGFCNDIPGADTPAPPAAALSRARSLVDYSSLRLDNSTAGSARAFLGKKGMWIDVGAFSKGYVADRAMEQLHRSGIRNALIAAGGTICARGCKQGGKPWKIGIRHPRKQGSFLTVIELHNRCVSTSGDYERYYTRKKKRITHIIDPRSGKPVETMQSVTVIGSSGMQTDTLSTALFVLGPQEGKRCIERIPDVEALLVDSSGTIHMSSGWPQKKVVY